MLCRSYGSSQETLLGNKQKHMFFSAHLEGCDSGPEKKSMDCMEKPLFIFIFIFIFILI